MSKNSLEVYRVGSRVKLADDVYGTIVGIHISADNKITYDCGWWNGRSYAKDTFNYDQIEVTLADKIRIGFA